MKKILFNYGTVGLMGEPAYKAASTFLKEYYEVGPPEILLTYEPYVERLLRELALLLSCGENEVTYIKNTTEGLALASEALPLVPGDEVLLWGNEYPASRLTWQKKKRDGIDVKIISGSDNTHLVDALIEAIGPKTKAISVAWAQHYDGYLPDLVRLGQLCRQKGIYLVVDGVQGVGVRNINLREVPIDILVCGGQKYLGGIVGIGFMYVRQDIIPSLKHIKVGIRSVESFDQDSYTIRTTARRFEDGTLNLLGIVALHAAIAHINELGMQYIEDTNLALLAEYKSILRSLEIPFIDHEHQSNIISLKTPDPAALVTFLRERAIYTKPLQDVVRISFSHRSTVDDFNILAGSVAEWMHQQNSYPVGAPTEQKLVLS